MSNRAIRRAAERAARKESRPSAESPVPPSISQTQAAANRANAQLSTGPRTSDGKAKVALNALKTGLTRRTVLLPGEDAQAYQDFVKLHYREYRPVGMRENELVQAIADGRWRLARIPALESNIYALAQIEFADLFPEYGSVVRGGLIEAKTFLVYQRQLNNLRIQEGRLRRQVDRDYAELFSLQTERRKAQEKENGFVISNGEMAAPESPAPSTQSLPAATSDAPEPHLLPASSSLSEDLISIRR